MTITTCEDGIRAATSIARDIADGTLSPADLEAQAVAELRELFADVVPGGPCWELQASVARGVLAAGGIAADELAEWTAVQRASEVPSIPDLPDAPSASIAVQSEELSPEAAQPDADDALPLTEEPAIAATDEPAVPVVQIPPRRADGYDPLRGSALGRGNFASD